MGLWQFSKPKLWTLGEQVVGALVTTMALSIGFMVFNDYLAPPPNLSGRWKATLTYLDTDLERFAGLKVTYQALLIQEGLSLRGTGEKMSDRGDGIEPRNYTGADRVNLEIGGDVTRNYFSRDRLSIHYREAGKVRASSTLHELVHFDRTVMCGCFISTIANSTGTVWWRRVDERASIYDAVPKPAACANLSCSELGEPELR